MSKSIFYHGTSADNLKSILKYGLSPHAALRKVVWAMTTLGYIYLWDSECTGYCEYYPSEMAMFSIPLSSDRRAVILELELDRNRWDLEVDEECYEGAVRTYRTIPPRYITGYQISEDLSPILPVILLACKDRICYNYSSLERWAVNQWEKSECYFEEAPIKWEHHTIERKKRTLKMKVA